jgi:hypothetical protein
MTDKANSIDNGNRLHFVEFMQMCADSGYISEPTAREICLFAKYQGGVEAIPAFPGDHPGNNDRFTDLLAFTPRDGRTFENYVVTDENSYAVELARTVALIPRIWKSISPLLFHAGTGQGKTHLLSAIATASRQNTLFLNLNDLKMGYKYCVRTNKESPLLSWITSHNFLLLDDLQFVHKDIEFQHFLCSVFNRMPHGKSAIVLCSNSEVENMQDFDATFFSRISSGISVELKPMDLAGRISVLERMFKSTGFGPGPEIINYIATRITQNIRTLKAAGRAVLANLLASPSRGGISLETVTSLLNSMNLMDPVRKNTEAAASSDDRQQQEEESPSPYIVVDIDDEENTAQESDEEKFKKALEEKRTDAAEERETAVTVDTETQENPAELGDGQETVTEKPVAEPKTHAREHTINVIESATTVTSQIEALKLAAERRIAQLEKKNPDSPEIAKLRFAIVFLDQGKIESAMLALK